MTVRASRKSVTFARPFSLSAIGREQPAGTYEVETEEELLEGLSFHAYRRSSTAIVLPAQPGSMILAEIVEIDPAELEAARERDAVAQACPDAAALGRAFRSLSKTSILKKASMQGDRDS